MADEKDAKAQALKIAIDQIEKQHGKGAVMRLGEGPIQQVEVISTGSISLDLCAGSQCGHGVDDDHIQCAAANESFDDFERLFAKFRLRQEEVVGVDPQSFGVVHIHGMLGIDKRGDPAAPLRFGNHMEAEGSFA